MKLTKSKLQQLIKEELNNFLGEDNFSVMEEYPDHYKFLQDVMEKGHVGDKHSEKYMTLMSWLTSGRLEGLEAIEDWDARKLIDAAKEDSNIKSSERSRKWKEENPDTRTPEERQDAADRDMDAAYQRDPEGFTRGT